MKFRHRIVPYWFINTLLKWIRLPQIAPKQFWAIIFRKRIKINCLKNWGSTNASPTYIIIINYDSILLDNCSNTAWANCSTTLTVWFCLFRNLIVTVFAVFWLILWVFYLLFSLFPGESIKNVSRFFVHLSHNIAWAKNNVNRHFLQNFGYDTYFANRDTRFGWCDTRFYVSACAGNTFLHSAPVPLYAAWYIFKWTYTRKSIVCIFTQIFHTSSYMDELAYNLHVSLHVHMQV